MNCYFFVFPIVSISRRFAPPLHHTCATRSVSVHYYFNKMSSQQRVHWAEELTTVNYSSSQSPAPSDRSVSSSSADARCNTDQQQPPRELDKQQSWHRFHNASSSSSDSESPSPSQSHRSQPLSFKVDRPTSEYLLVGDCKQPLHATAPPGSPVQQHQQPAYHRLDSTSYSSPTPTARDPLRLLMSTSDEEQRKLICRELFDCIALLVVDLR